ncbi:MAG: hypothetical protein LBK47_02170 [Prevotellaceae bacterium]|nr:hypothetical protein [Prevotellaceae bacterium]
MTGGGKGEMGCFAAATPPQNTPSLLLKKITVIPTKPARYERARGGTCRQAQNDGSHNDGGRRFLHSTPLRGACPERSRGGRNDGVAVRGKVPPLRYAPVGMTGRR